MLRFILFNRQFNDCSVRQGYNLPVTKGTRTEREQDCILSRIAIVPATLNRRKNHEWELDAEYCLTHGVRDDTVNSLDELL